MNLTTTNVPAAPCPICGSENDHATGHGAPKPGDASICLFCGEVSIFAKEGGLREPTEYERRLLAFDTRVQMLRAEILKGTRQ